MSLFKEDDIFSIVRVKHIDIVIYICTKCDVCETYKKYVQLLL